jgi:hypothetical protein
VLGRYVKAGLLVAAVVFLVVEGFFVYRWYERSQQASGAASGDATGDAGDPVMVGAGDIAVCSTDADEATARLLDNIPGTVFTVGDNAYPSGTAAEFEECYGPSWGRHKARTKPAPGNHEYETAGASGYFGYFGAAASDPSKGYYSYDRGGWHVVALNSNCKEVGGCDADSPQGRWLRNDLAANPSGCTLAYFHHPLFSSGSANGNQLRVRPLWNALYAAGAEAVIGAHDHDYERFAPQRPNGTRDEERGMRQFVVGTGGGTQHGFGEVQPNSQARNASTPGVLRLALEPGSYEWEFTPVAGKTFTDSGTMNCN